MHPFATVGQRSDMRGRNVHSLHKSYHVPRRHFGADDAPSLSRVISVFYAADVWQLCIIFGTDKYAVRYVLKGRHGVNIHMSR